MKLLPLVKEDFLPSMPPADIYQEEIRVESSMEAILDAYQYRTMSQDMIYCCAGRVAMPASIIPE